MRVLLILSVCLLLTSVAVMGEEAQMVFDIFASGSPTNAEEATVVADAKDVHENTVYEKPEIRIAAALIVWNEGISPATDHSIYRIATHPYVEANLKMDITCISRARSAAIHSVIHHIEQQLATDSSGDIAFTHVLLVSQDVDFTVEDLDALVAAKVPIVAGVSVTKHVPYVPNFLPSYATVSKEYQKINKDITAQSFDSEEELHQLFSMLLETNGNDLIEAVAMSYDFALIEAAALHKIARRSAEAHEWFWPNARGDDIYYHSVGDCSQLSQVLRSKSKEERLYNLAMESPAAMYMEEEDLCFSALARRFGFKLHVLPSVQYGRTVPVRLSLSAYREDIIGRTAGSSLLQKISFPHDAFVVQNKLSDLKKGKKLVQVGSPTGARVVLATPVWQNLESSAAESLFTLTQHPDIVGRVAIVHEDIAFARNALVRKVYEEFGDDGVTHILFVDADMEFLLVDYVRLVLADHPITMGLAVKRNAQDHPPAYLPLSGNADNYEPLISALTVQPAPAIPIKSGGMAFTLIRMDVFDELEETNEVTGEKEWFWTEHILDEDSHVERNLSEDYAFCRRAREHGFDIYLHAAAQVRHLHTEPLHIGHWLRAGGLIE